MPRLFTSLFEAQDASRTGHWPNSKDASALRDSRLMAKWSDRRIKRFRQSFDPVRRVRGLCLEMDWRGTADACHLFNYTCLRQNARQKAGLIAHAHKSVWPARLWKSARIIFPLIRSRDYLRLRYQSCSIVFFVITPRAHRSLLVSRRSPVLSHDLSSVMWPRLALPQDWPILVTWLHLALSHGH